MVPSPVEEMTLEKMCDEDINVELIGILNWIRITVKYKREESKRIEKRVESFRIYLNQTRRMLGLPAREGWQRRPSTFAVFEVFGEEKVFGGDRRFLHFQQSRRGTLTFPPFSHSSSLTQSFTFLFSSQVRCVRPKRVPFSLPLRALGRPHHCPRYTDPLQPARERSVWTNAATLCVWVWTLRMRGGAAEEGLFHF